MADFDPKSKTVLVWDSGIFVEIARRLAEDFGRVLYFAPWASGYPTSRGLLIGAGDDMIERIEDPWPYVEDDEIDLYVFPDCYEGHIQSYLASQGKRVWGCRRGAELELDRPKAKEIMEKAKARAKHHMENAAQLVVPTPVEIGFGDTWADAK